MGDDPGGRPAGAGIPFSRLTAYVGRRLDYPGLKCSVCWTHHVRDGATYPCPECPEELALDPADRLALDVWRLLGDLQRPAVAALATTVVREQLADLTSGEWLALLDRLAVIEDLAPPPETRSDALVAALLRMRQ